MRRTVGIAVLALLLLSLCAIPVVAKPPAKSAVSQFEVTIENPDGTTGSGIMTVNQKAAWYVFNGKKLTPGETYDLAVNGALLASGTAGTDGRLHLEGACAVKVETVTVTVAAPPVAPVAAFAATPTDLSVAFTDQSTGATSWVWDFGDGGSSTDQSPTYVYAAAGTYTVKLTVTGPGGTDEATQTVTVTTVTLKESFVSWWTFGYTYYADKTVAWIELTGHLRGPDGEPIPGATLDVYLEDRVTPLTDDSGNEVTVTTDAYGCWQVYYCMVSHYGWVWAPATADIVTQRVAVHFAGNAQYSEAWSPVL
jgi:PKD repeat protein